MVEKKMNVVDVTIELDNGKEIVGQINMIDYKRFSDFIENHNGQNLKIFNAIDKSKTTITEPIKRFLLVPKGKICVYEPFDNKKRNSV
jgi:hypothetical protein